MTTPDIITPVSGQSPQTDVGGSWHTGVYQYHSTDGTKEVYSLSFPQADGSYTDTGIHSAIYVETSGSTANTWYDYTLTSDPQTVTDNGTQILLYNTSGSLMVRLPKPTTASWIGTNSEGTSTGTSTPSGTIVDNSTHYTFTVASTAPSSSGVVAYNVLRDDVFYGTITHTNGSTNPMDIHLSSRASSNWKLTIVSTTGLYQSGTLATFTNNIRKGVFCNFW